MKNNIRYIIETYPFLLDMYNKDDLIHIKNIYFDHLTYKRIIENDFSFLQFVQFCNESGYKPHKYSIIRYDTKKPFSETNIHLKPANDYQRKLDELSKIIKKTDRHKIKLKLNDDPYVIIKSENLTKKPEYKLHTKEHSPTSTTDYLIRYYPKNTLEMMRNNYGNKKRTNLIADGFSFEKYVKKAYELGYVNSDVHQIRRINTSEKFDETNMRLKPADGLIHKLKNMSKIIEKNERHKVSLKINDDNPFQIRLKHSHAKHEKRIYIKQ